MKIFILGDSISIQYGPYLEQMLRGVMGYSRKEGNEEALRNLDVPQGANGGDSDRVLEYLLIRARSGGIDADCLLVNAGLHDIKRAEGHGPLQVPLARYRTNLEAIIGLSRAMGLRLIWILTTPCDDGGHNAAKRGFERYNADIQAYNAAATQLMQAAGVPLIDLYTFTLNLAPAAELYADHVHFPPVVQQQQAAFIAGWLGAWADRQP